MKCQDFIPYPKTIHVGHYTLIDLERMLFAARQVYAREREINGVARIDNYLNKLSSLLTDDKDEINL